MENFIYIDTFNRDKKIIAKFFFYRNQEFFYNHIEDTNIFNIVKSIEAICNCLGIYNYYVNTQREIGQKLWIELYNLNKKIKITNTYTENIQRAFCLPMGELGLEVHSPLD